LGSRGPALSAYVLQYVSALPSSFSVVWGVPGIVAMSLSFFLGRLLDPLRTEHKLYASSAFKLLQTLAVAMIPFVRDVWGLVGLLVLSRLGSMLSVAASKAAQGSISRRVEHFGARQTAFSLGNATGPLLGAALYKVVGPASLFAIAGLGIVSSALYAWSAREAKNQA
jgi:predicted MFS family arabinose efflux permease